MPVRPRVGFRCLFSEAAAAHSGNVKKFGGSQNGQLVVRSAGGNRTHFDRVATGRLTIRLQRCVAD